MKNIYTGQDSEYLSNNPTWHAEDSPWKAQQIMKMISRQSLTPKSVAEVGCGAGEILNQLHQQMPNDVRFVGYDISQDAIQFAQQRKKDRLSFRNEDFLKSEVDFDLLLMIDVFEHVPDYIGFLNDCRKKAQQAIFHIPLDISIDSVVRNKLMSRRNNYGHLHYFSKETAIATLEDSGYRVIDYFFTANSLDLPRQTMNAHLAYIPRKILASMSKGLAAKLLGGFSLLVLANCTKE